MSDVQAQHGHDSHAAPAHSNIKKIVNIVFLLALPLLLVLGLVKSYTAHEAGNHPAAMDEQAVMARIQKVGKLSMGASVRVPKSGEEVFKAQCTNCHTAGLVGAPKFADAAAWAPRIKTGFEALLNSALKGKGSMGAQGGGAFADDDIARAVVYMANAGGAKFVEPKAPATPASAASASK